MIRDSPSTKAKLTLRLPATREEVDYAIAKIREQVQRLRELSPLWDMYKEGIDLNSVQWSGH